MKRKSGRVPLLLFLSALVLIPVISGGCAYITGEAINVPAPPPLVIKDITPEEIDMITMFSSRYPAFLFIDVRTPEEYATGYIDNAINIDFNSADFRKIINKLEKNAFYVIYCQSGKRSAAASKVMAELGFKYINNMLGGFSDWEAAGLPVSK
jgi:rhodanese-related sulfurtransferase